MASKREIHYCQPMVPAEPYKEHFFIGDNEYVLDANDHLMNYSKRTKSWSSYSRFRGAEHVEKLRTTLKKSFKSVK